MVNLRPATCSSTNNLTGIQTGENAQHTNTTRELEKLQHTQRLSTDWPTAWRWTLRSRQVARPYTPRIHSSVTSHRYGLRRTTTAIVRQQITRFLSEWPDAVPPCERYVRCVSKLSPLMWVGLKCTVGGAISLLMIIQILEIVMGRYTDRRTVIS
jgi:hypothetical protein